MGSRVWGRLASAAGYMLGRRTTVLRQPQGLILHRGGRADGNCVASAGYLVTWATSGHGMLALAALAI